MANLGHVANSILSSNFLYTDRCLQEMSRNVDALALAPKHAVPDMSRISKEIFNKRQPEQVRDGHCPLVLKFINYLTLRTIRKSIYSGIRSHSSKWQ